MRFEWDEVKANKNFKKHGLDFETAARVFGDPFRIEMYDSKYSCDEDRYITIGEIGGTACVVFVSYTERTDIIRMISARKANASERSKYYDNPERD